MKILMTVENYYPNLSGVPIVAKYLAEGIARLDGYEVHIATRTLGYLPKCEEYSGVTIHRFDIKNDLIKRPRGSIDEYIQFVKKEKFDCIILQCTQCITTDVLLPYLNTFSGKKILYSHGFSGMALKRFSIMGTIRNTVGNTLNYYIWRHYYTNVLPKYVSRFDSIVCLSENDNDYEYFLKFDVPVHIISNCAEEEFFNLGHSNPLKKYISDLNEEYAICVAYYSDVKNQLGIVQEFFKANVNRKIDLVFIGTEKNDYYKKLSAIADSLMKDNPNRRVHLLVKVDRRDIPGAVENAVMYLCGSKREAFSISLIESMASGTPFIGTDVGNTSCLPGGIVISDISKMHEAIEKMMMDDYQRKELAELGIQYARENCRADIAVHRLVDIIEG